MHHPHIECHAFKQNCCEPISQADNTQSLLTLNGAWCRLELAALVLWSLLIYSLPAHKEFRFLLPALLLLMPYCGVALDDLASRWKQHSAAENTQLHQVSRHDKFESSCRQCKVLVDCWSGSSIAQYWMQMCRALLMGGHAAVCADPRELSLLSQSSYARHCKVQLGVQHSVSSIGLFD